ncbi:TonB dependent receptor [Sphingobium faniae]|nr:TonB dependent receptor [Sphingobium faniae]
MRWSISAWRADNRADNPAAIDGMIPVTPGDRLPGIPRHRGLLSDDYVAGGFTIGGNIQAQSGQRLFGGEGNQQPPTHSFAIFNLRGSVRITGPLTLFGRASNILNCHYATFGTFSETGSVDLIKAPGASNPRSLGPGTPRRILVGLRTQV